MKRIACALALAALAIGPAGAQAPAAAPTLTVRGAPDVQVVVGPGAGGWQVALVYPKAVAKADAQKAVESVARALGSPARSVAIETHRLERDDPRIGQVPSMTSATFVTAAELVDYTAGTLSLEPILIGLQNANRVNVTFLVPGRFAYRGAQRSADNRVTVEFAGGEGAYTFVTNIVSRPLDGLHLSSLSDAGTQAPAGAARRGSPAGAIVAVSLLAMGAAAGTYLLVRRSGRR